MAVQSLKFVESKIQFLWYARQENINPQRVMSSDLHGPPAGMISGNISEDHIEFRDQIQTKFWIMAVFMHAWPQRPLSPDDGEIDGDISFGMLAWDYQWCDNNTSIDLTIITWKC